MKPPPPARSTGRAAIELRLGRRVQLHDARVALRLEAVEADPRPLSSPGAGGCTIRLSVAPEHGEVSTFYLTLDPEAPQLATASAFGYRVSLRGVTSDPADDGVGAPGDPRATIVLEPM